MLQEPGRKGSLHLLSWGPLASIADRKGMRYEVQPEFACLITSSSRESGLGHSPQTHTGGKGVNREVIIYCYAVALHGLWNGGFAGD